MCYLSTHCTVYNSSEQVLCWGEFSGNIQRRSFDGDTRDIARVWKHPSLTAQHINLATKNSLQLSPLYKRFSKNKRSTPSNRAASFGRFYYAVSSINFEQQKEPPFVCHLQDKAKPRQMNSSACDCLKWREREKGSVFFCFSLMSRLSTTVQIQQMCLFYDWKLWQSKARKYTRRAQFSHRLSSVSSIAIIDHRCLLSSFLFPLLSKN